MKLHGKVVDDIKSFVTPMWFYLSYGVYGEEEVGPEGRGS